MLPSKWPPRHLKREYVDEGIRQDRGSSTKTNELLCWVTCHHRRYHDWVSHFSLTVPYVTEEMTTVLKNTLSMLFEIVTSDASIWCHSEQLLDLVGEPHCPHIYSLGENPTKFGFFIKTHRPIWLSKNTTGPTDIQTDLQKCEKTNVGNNVG